VHNWEAYFFTNHPDQT